MFFSHLVGSAINLTRRLGSGRQTVEILRSQCESRSWPTSHAVMSRGFVRQSIDRPHLSAGELPLTVRRSAMAEIIVSVCLGFVADGELCDCNTVRRCEIIPVFPDKIPSSLSAEFQEL